MLDEISWMAHYSPSFPEVLKSAWDDVLKKHPKLILVLCGSVSHWITRNIIGNSAYVGRRSLDMVVPELPLAECVKFWGEKADRIDVREIIDVLSVTGGIPRYLEEVNPSLSAVENIRRLCFAPQSLLRMEFDDMFNDVVTSKQKFAAKVLRTFIDGPKSGAEIAKALGVDTGGDVSSALTMLRESGFLAEECPRNPETGELSRERRFRLRDNYTRFYLKFIEPYKEVIDEGAFLFSSLSELDGIDSVLGLAFENLVVNNYRMLLPYMHLANTLITAAGPYRRRAAKSARGKPGVQVDLMLQTRRSLWFVEVKRKREIDREIETEVERKVKAVSRREGVSAKMALVYDGHLIKGKSNLAGEAQYLPLAFTKPPLSLLQSREGFEEHIEEHMAVCLRILRLIRQLPDGKKKEFLNEYAIQCVNRTYGFFLILSPTDLNRRRLYTFDRKLDTEFPDIYARCQIPSWMRAVKAFHFHPYRLLVRYYALRGYEAR